MQKKEEYAIIRTDDDYISARKIVNGEYDKALSFVAEYAKLSAIVYDEKGEIHCSKDQNEGTPFLIKEWVKLDIDFNAHRPQIKGKWIGSPKVVSYYKVVDETVYVCMIFRGTKLLLDWYANFDWITRYFPFLHNLYKQVRLVTNDYIKAIEDFLKNQDFPRSIKAIKFTVTGHSLGGGLAQQAAYASTKVQTVFAFQSSPVTGFFSVKKKERINNSKGISIYRIWEKGEVLGYLRAITKVYAKFKFKPNINPRIVEIRFDFIDFDYYVFGSSIDAHNMNKLANHIADVRDNHINDFA